MCPFSSSNRLVLLACLLSFLLPGSRGLSQPVEPESQEPANREDEDWLEFYYQDPSPDRVVPQLKNWAADGTLDNESARPALIAFLSQVIRANRERLDEWHADLRGLAPRHMQIFHTAMLFSRTGEADEILGAQFGERYEAEKEEVGKILEMPLDARPTIDMLWGFYYATGSANAIRRIVLCFRLVDAPENPDGVDVPSGFIPYYKLLPRTAFGSLVANAERHSRIVDILETLLEKDESLMPIEWQAVYDVLSEVKPEQYPPGEGEPPVGKPADSDSKEAA